MLLALWAVTVHHPFEFSRDFAEGIYPPAHQPGSVWSHSACTCLPPRQDNHTGCGITGGVAAHHGLYSCISTVKWETAAESGTNLAFPENAKQAGLAALPLPSPLPGWKVRAHPATSRKRPWRRGVREPNTRAFPHSSEQPQATYPVVEETA